MQDDRAMKVLGGRIAPYWERFNRLQRLANTLLAGRLGTKCVHRFKTHEEYEAWKMEQRLKPPTLPATTTTSG